MNFQNVSITMPGFHRKYQKLKQNDSLSNEGTADKGKRAETTGEHFAKVEHEGNSTFSKMAGHLRFDPITQVRPGK